MNNQIKSSISGKTVLLLGASSGIGLATAKAAATEGAHVIIASANPQRIASALKELPENSIGYTVDLGSEEEIKALFDKVGRIDHMVYTAGENISLGNVADTDIDQSRVFFNIRFWGAFAAVKYATAHINEGGSISLMSGIASARPGKGWALGASICSAMEGFVRTMAVELAPLRVNCIAPGVVRTNLWNSLSDTDRNDLYTSAANTLPVKRIGEAEDIALAYIYLMKQRYGTGQVLTVDGGSVLV